MRSDDPIDKIDLTSPIDISIPLRFHGPQPNAFGVERAAAKACEFGRLIGDTRRGGSCNFEQLTLIPHCNGTHTECVGHITNVRISIRECLTDVMVPARLVTVEPVPASDSGESYAVPFAGDDLVITRRSLEGTFPPNSVAALVVRSLPNDERKLTRVYGGTAVPFFTNEAIELIVANGVRHLLVDLPSIDRLSDEGKLSNHRIFWNIEQGSYDLNASARKNCTVTELTYVPNAVADGEYLLNLQIAPFESDASPSRPLLFRIKNS